MRHFALLAAGTIVAGALAPATAQADETVRVNGRLYTCTNSCVVHTDDDGWSITDCCGGRVKTTYIIRK
ncbi:hypothetical protein GCM10028862_17890 [Luteimonas pelagia]